MNDTTYFKDKKYIIMVKDWEHDILKSPRMQWIIFQEHEIDVSHSYIPETCSWFPLHWELHSSPDLISNIILIFKKTCLTVVLKIVMMF